MTADHDDGGADRPRGRKAPSAFRTISEVADELHIPQHVLRFWETKFPQLTPLKRGGGRRYYRPEDIDLLRRISDLLYIQGYTIKGVQRLLRDGPAEDEAAESDTPMDPASDEADPTRPGRPQLPLPGLPEASESQRTGPKPVVRVRADGSISGPRPDAGARAEERLSALRTALGEVLSELRSIRALIVPKGTSRGG